VVDLLVLERLDRDHDVLHAMGNQKDEYCITGRKECKWEGVEVYGLYSAPTKRMDIFNSGPLNNLLLRLFLLQHLQQVQT